MNVYIVPIAEKGFVPIDEQNKVRYYIMDESGNLAVCVPFDTIESAVSLAKKNGWNLPNEP